MDLEGSQGGGSGVGHGPDRRATRRAGWWAPVAAAGLAVVSLTGCPSSTGDDEPAAGSASVPIEAPATGSSAPSTIGAARPVLDAEAATYADAIASLDDTGMDEDQGECLAVEWVAAIGVPAFESAGITPDELRSEERSLADVPIDVTVAGTMVDGFDRCGVDAKAMIVDEAAGRQVRNEAVADCLDERLTPQDARDAWIATLSGQDTSALEAIITGCLPPELPTITGLVAPDD